MTASTKEILKYRAAVWIGYNEIKEREILSINTILKIQAVLEGNNAGIRKVPGTSLMNDATGEIIYTPPSNEAILNKLLANLEKFIKKNLEKELKNSIIKFLSNETLVWSLISIEDIPVISSVIFSTLTPSTKSMNLTIPAVSVIIGVVYGSHVAVV